MKLRTHDILDCGGKRSATPLSHARNARNVRLAPPAPKRRRRFALPAHSKTPKPSTLNSQPTFRKGKYYRAQLSLTNAGSAVWQSVTNLAVLNESTNDVRSSGLTNNVFLQVSCRCQS
jgi:hypothetical protein